MFSIFSFLAISKRILDVEQVYTLFKRLHTFQFSNVKSDLNQPWSVIKGSSKLMNILGQEKKKK